jgi:hypothetical protein
VFGQIATDTAPADRLVKQFWRGRRL